MPCMTCDKVRIHEGEKGLEYLCENGDKTRCKEYARWELEQKSRKERVKLYEQKIDLEEIERKLEKDEEERSKV